METTPSASTESLMRAPLIPQLSLLESIQKECSRKRVITAAVTILLLVILEVFVHPDFVTAEKDGAGNRELLGDGERWKPYFVISTLFYGIILITDEVPMEAVLLSLAVLYAFTGIITLDQAFAGFSNPGIVAYGALFVISAAFQEVRVLEPLLAGVLGNPSTLCAAQLRLALPVVLLSAIFNNGPVVAMLLPIVQGWGERNGLATPKLLMPLAFSSTLGGTLTMIGSAANLIAASLVRTMEPPVELGFFDVTGVGVVIASVGVLYLVVCAPFLLPNTPSGVEPLPVSSQLPLLTGGSDTPVKTQGTGSIVDTAIPAAGDTLEIIQFPMDDSSTPETEILANGSGGYVVLFVVLNGSALVGRSPIEAGIPRLPGIKIISVIRNSAVIPGNPIQVRFCAGDFLKVIATPAAVGKLRLCYDGLVPAMHEKIALLGARRRRRQLVEAVVGVTSNLLGQPFDQLSFVNKSGAVILSVRRQTKLATGGSGATFLVPHLSGDFQAPWTSYHGVCEKDFDKFVLEPGDVILCEAFLDRLAAQPGDFSLVSAVQNSKPPRKGRRMDTARASISLIGFLFAIGITALDLESLHNLQLAPMLITLAVVTVLMKVLDWREAMQSINGSVMLSMAASFSLSAAMRESAAAASLSNGLVSLGLKFGVFGVLCMVYLGTALMTNIISNTATAVLMLPIAIACADKMKEGGVAHPLGCRDMVLLVIFAANVPFATPFSSVCNMLVIEAGGYRFMDFVKFGVPLQFILMIVTCVVVLWTYE